MIKIAIKKLDNKVTYFEATGHANSGKIGQDLVCSAVSAIITGAFNALINIKDYECELNEGHALLKIDQLSNHDEIVLETMIIQLQTVEESYSKFIKISNI